MIHSLHDLDDRMVYGILGGSVAGACLSQLILGQVNSLPIAMGMVGGYLFYNVVPSSKKNRNVGANYSS